MPWRIEIALFGSFGVAYVTSMARRRRRAWAAYPLALVALLWIAPFYGFFSAPLFLGVSLNTMCPGRPIVTVVLAALGMRAGEQVGLAAAALDFRGASWRERLSPVVAAVSDPPEHAARHRPRRCGQG